MPTDSLEDDGGGAGVGALVVNGCPASAGFGMMSSAQSAAQSQRMPQKTKRKKEKNLAALAALPLQAAQLQGDVRYFIFMS